METLYVFVEGPDDERFFQSHYSNRCVKLIKYANTPPKAINGMLRTLKRQRSPYIFLTDSDGAAPDAKIEKVLRKFTECEPSQVFVICFEIESWYLAGLNQQDSQKLGIKFISLTDSITKEQFDSLIPKGFSRLDIMLEILQRFDKTSALQRNTSYRYYSNCNYA